MTRATVAKIAKAHRNRLFILAADKNIKSYERIADVVDGNLYYWSSVNPQTNKHYADKLISFGNAVRAHGGLWVAPAAPGFDARLVGGTSSIDRRDGETLRAEWNAAISSRPAAIGISTCLPNSQVQPTRHLPAWTQVSHPARQARCGPS